MWLFDVEWLKTNAQVYDVGTYIDEEKPPYDAQRLFTSGACETLIIDCYDSCVPESKDLAFIGNNPAYRQRCVDLGHLVHPNGKPNFESAKKVKTGKIVWYRVSGAKISAGQS